MNDFGIAWAIGGWLLLAFFAASGVRELPVTRTCSIDGCERSYCARGWCSLHWQRWQKHGDPLHARSASDRFWLRLEVSNDGCWQWIGQINPGGYGVLWAVDRKVMAHRFAFELLVGSIPEGWEVDHLCLNRRCVNPGHLEAVTPTENIRRAAADGLMGAHNRAKSHCPQGHPYDDENTLVDEHGKRRCRVCRKAQVRAAHQRSTKTPAC